MTGSDGRRRHERDRLATGLRLRREALGLSRRDVADRSGLSYPYVSQLENGDREPSMDALGRLAGALDTTTEDLLAAPAHGRAMSAPAPAAPAPAAPEPAAPSPVTADSIGAAPDAARWHANPSFAATRAVRTGSAGSRRLSGHRPADIDAVVEEAYSALSRLEPARRLDAAGVLLARCVRDATPPA